MQLLTMPWLGGCSYRHGCGCGCGCGCARRHRLCDSLGDAYPEPYQTAFQRGRTAALPRHECPVAGMRPALHQNPPTISAATWAAQVGAALTASLAGFLPCCRSVHRRPCL